MPKRPSVSLRLRPLRLRYCKTKARAPLDLILKPKPGNSLSQRNASPDSLGRAASMVRFVSFGMGKLRVSRKRGVPAMFGNDLRTQTGPKCLRASPLRNLRLSRVSNGNLLTGAVSRLWLGPAWRYRCALEHLTRGAGNGQEYA